MITVTVQLTSTSLVVRKSVDDTTALRVRCAMVVPSATMRVQKLVYAYVAE